MSALRLRPAGTVWLLKPNGLLQYENGCIVVGTVARLRGRGRNRSALVRLPGRRSWIAIAQLYKQS